MSEISFNIEVPADEDGFVLCRCPLCGEFFKLLAEDMQADDVLEIWCPACGLRSEDYLTDEVVSLASCMAKNRVEALICDEFRKTGRDSSNSCISFIGSESTPEYEASIASTIDVLEVQSCRCCGRLTKINPFIKVSGGYCPFCGGDYEYQ